MYEVQLVIRRVREVRWGEKEEGVYEGSNEAVIDR